MISDRIYDDILPQMKNLNFGIPILIHCFSRNVCTMSGILP